MMDTKEKEEQEFEEKLGKALTRAEIKEYWDTFKEHGEEKADQLIKKHAAAHSLELPENLERRVRTWNGDHVYKRIKKTGGSKYAIELMKRIHETIPLSIKGFDAKFNKESSTWIRESEGKKFELFIPVGETTLDMKPASGDLAKRTIMATFRFAIARKTLDPGPIFFNDLLGLLGQSKCSMETRKNIKKYCQACARTSMTITRLSEKGKQNYWRYTPFFKDYLWQGELEGTAKIYPIINEEFEKMLLQEGLSQYIWIIDKRLEMAKELTDRDRLAQDQFLLIKGLSSQRIHMRNFLEKFGQFTEQKLEAMSLKEIKAWVNKNINYAIETGLLKYTQISPARNKKKYLDQIIVLFPMQQDKFKFEGRELTKEERETVERFINLTYGQVELYIKKPEEESREQLSNYIRANGREIVEQALDEFEDELDDPFYEGPEGPVAHFWQKLQEYRNGKKC